MLSQTVIKPLFKGAVVSGCTLLPLVGYAGSIDLPLHGLQSSLRPVRLDCGDDKVLVGVTGTKGNQINSIRPLCIKFVDNYWIGEISAGSIAGDTGSNPLIPTQIGARPFFKKCPRDKAISAIIGNYNQYINQVSFYCQSLQSINRRALTSPFIDIHGLVSGKRVIDYEGCLGSKVARGVQVKASIAINSLGLICHNGATPYSQNLSAPSNVVAVNLVNPQIGPTTSQATPYAQVQWTDQSTIETGYQIKVFRVPGIQQIVSNQPAVTGSGSRQALNITDLSSGNYTTQVCTVSASSASEAMSCSGGASFTISGGSGSGSSTCSPVITSAEQIGAGTGRVSWTHGCNNPSSFSIKLSCGSSPLSTVATAFDGAARQEIFPFGVGSGVLQVCAIFSGQSATAFCSVQRSFQCN